MEIFHHFWRYFQYTRARHDSFEVDIQVSYIVFYYSGKIKLRSIIPIDVSSGLLGKDELAKKL